MDLLKTLRVMPSDAIRDATTRTGRSQIRKYEQDETDKKLEEQLREWRNKRAKEVLKDADYKDFGPDLFLHEKKLSRIIDCAHRNKISSIADIVKETSWRRAEQHGGEIIAILQAVRPPPALVTAFTSAPLRPPLQPIAHVDVNQEPIANRKRKSPTCSRCSMVGHTSGFRLRCHSDTSLTAEKFRAMEPLPCDLGCKLPAEHYAHWVACKRTSWREFWRYSRARYW